MKTRRYILYIQRATPIEHHRRNKVLCRARWEFRCNKRGRMLLVLRGVKRESRRASLYTYTARAHSSSFRETLGGGGGRIRLILSLCSGGGGIHEPFSSSGRWTHTPLKRYYRFVSLLFRILACCLYTRKCTNKMCIYNITNANAVKSNIYKEIVRRAVLDHFLFN